MTGPSCDQPNGKTCPKKANLDKQQEELVLNRETADLTPLQEHISSGTLATGSLEDEVAGPATVRIRRNYTNP